MKIVTVNNYRTDENCYILINDGHAAVIDPGSEAEEIIESAEGAKIDYILLTHCHYDHIIGMEELRNLTGAKFLASRICAENTADSTVNLTEAALGEAIEVKMPEEIISSEINLCGMDIKVINTPGHTSCGVCYLVGKNLFTGDTLFLRNTGRWDLPTGNEEILMKSIREKLYTLEDDIAVYPGHGKQTSIGYEKKYNFVCRQEQ